MIGLSSDERAAGRNNYDFFCFLVWPFVEGCESTFLIQCFEVQYLTHSGTSITDWLAAVSLFALAPVAPPTSADQPVAWFAEKAFQSSAQRLAKTLFAQGDVSYLEAVNQGTSAYRNSPLIVTDSAVQCLATLLNAFQRMVDLGLILTRRSTGKKPVPLMALHPEWVPARNADGSIEAEGQLWTFVERLSRFRREGKK